MTIDTGIWNRETLLLKKALQAEIFRLIFVGYQSVASLKKLEQFLRDAFPERPFHFLKLQGLTYELLMESLLAIEEGIVFIPDFEYTLKRDDLRVAFNQRRDLIGQKKYAFIACMPQEYLQKMPKLLPDWWSVRTRVMDLSEIEIESREDPKVNEDKHRI